MARGFKSGGRKPGSKNKRTAALEAATAETIATMTAVLGDAFDGDAHALLVSIYKDTGRDITLRIDAAKAAIRFEKPALGAIETGPEVLERYVARVPQKAGTTETWQQQHAPQTIQ